MIQKLKILNFQSHKDSQLDFAPGVNVIVGASDSGKTAIIRALRWLLKNKPSGDAFRSTWGGDTKVQLEIGENRITREKGKENAYHLSKKGSGTYDTYKAFGNDVPEVIQKVLNVDDTNLQQQLDTPFLISNSPGEVATFFNKVAHLDQIDTSIKSIQGQIRTLTGQITADESSLQASKQCVGQFDYIDKFEIDLEQLETDEKQLRQSQKAWPILLKIIDSINDIDIDLQEASKFTVLEEEVDELLKMFEEKNDLETSLDSLEHVIELLQELTILSTKNTKTMKLGALVEPLLGYYEWYHDLQSKKGKLMDTITFYAELEEKAKNDRIKLGKLEEQFLEHMPDTCPLCGSETIQN